VQVQIVVGFLEYGSAGIFTPLQALSCQAEAERTKLPGTLKNQALPLFPKCGLCIQSWRWKQQENVAAYLEGRYSKKVNFFPQEAGTICFANKKKQRPKNFGAKMATSVIYDYDSSGSVILGL